MVVQVVEWEWIFGVFVCVEMGRFELRWTEGEIVVVVEVNGMDNIDISIEDSEGRLSIWWISVMPLYY